MLQEYKPKRRVVTKKAYAAKVGAVTTLVSVGVGIFLFGVICALFALLCTVFMLFNFSLSTLPVSLFMMLLFGGGSAVLLYFGRRLVKEAKQIEVGIPLTRANTGSLPVRESLVRASKEPVQAQQAVLLRAASGTETTPAEQLVRPFHAPVLGEQALLLPETHPALTIAANAASTPAETFVHVSNGNEAA